ncbi:MAG: hypothetical protein ABIH65_02470 [Nanoarchaeota archaeon]
MKIYKKELKKEKTIEYLEGILSRRDLIVNLMRLDVPGFGEVTVTSMVDYHFNNGRLIPYFTFIKGKKDSGKFHRENNRYFIQRYIK